MVSKYTEPLEWYLQEEDEKHAADLHLSGDF